MYPSFCFCYKFSYFCVLVYFLFLCLFIIKAKHWVGANGCDPIMLLQGFCPLVEREMYRIEFIMLKTGSIMLKSRLKMHNRFSCRVFSTLIHVNTLERIADLPFYIHLI